mmetsp:Transcript_22172/g.68101  ORF Transcript_22172/g.68101 Transcript_22172/m.68101 type:complete len:433 (-) Transcript_22172:2170-3468(-)|eukprot:CAMPEP_0118859258 /NCGR_PEP_ID=MMETSP1163-20130328/5582_1 /TAXON_ID=124430 /ORGANISM="Phaeomonas parva, Strain CCMP2877" /LENGTH=432 /DNA_ID=CAMNT_0006792819 /DNA_START=107 /DNA_END=1405 /DNA_ORIENTATION=+
MQRLSVALLAALAAAPAAKAFNAGRIARTRRAPAVRRHMSDVTTESASDNFVPGEEVRSKKAGQAPKDGSGRVIGDYGVFDYGYWLQDPKIPLPPGVVDGDAPEFFPVSQEQIETLERDGVVHVKGVLSEEWVEYLRACTMYQVENPHIWSFAGTASKLYDYIQRNVWQTNAGFTKFMYQSPVGSVLSQAGKTDTVRISTDLLMVNPNRGFKWHQDNQNGPINFDDGIRFWITMDDTPSDYGAPVYLQGSHRNTAVDDQQVFVDINEEGLEDYRDKQLTFRTQAGDMLIWHPRTIHKIDGPKSGVWTQFRRVLGGTVAKDGALYQDKRGSGGVFSDLGSHSLGHLEPLKSAYFPQIYPAPIPEEMKARERGEVQRDIWDVPNKVGQLFGKMATKRFGSWFDVLGSTNDAEEVKEVKEVIPDGKPKNPTTPFG